MPRRPAPARALSVAIGSCLLITAALAAAPGEAKGSFVHKGKTIALKYAAFVKGPDTVDPKKTIRRLVLSPTDVTAALKACNAMTCGDGGITEGMTVDLDADNRVNYWMVYNGQKVQYSGSKPLSVLTVSASDAKHLAGTLSFDDTAPGGPKVEVEFDAVFVKEIKSAR